MDQSSYMQKKMAKLIRNLTSKLPYYHLSVKKRSTSLTHEKISNMKSTVKSKVKSKEFFPFYLDIDAIKCINGPKILFSLDYLNIWEIFLFLEDRGVKKISGFSLSNNFGCYPVLKVHHSISSITLIKN